jgi:hypothetical protein
MGKKKLEHTAKIIPFPSHRIVRWTRTAARSALLDRIRKLLKLALKLLDAA